MYIRSGLLCTQVVLYFLIFLPHARLLASPIYTRPAAYTTLTRLTARAHIVVLVALVHARRSLSR